MKQVNTTGVPLKIDNCAYSLCKKSMLMGIVYRKTEVKLEFLESMIDNIIRRL